MGDTSMVYLLGVIYVKVPVHTIRSDALRKPLISGQRK
jgi:hypothetical protein